jgi:glycosyltransferase involved in cell wall biosynthesis
MRILYASERPPYPFFLGGAARCAHLLLRTLATELGADCHAVGARDYTATPWSYPEPSDYETLGIVTATMDRESGDAIDCGYAVRILPRFAQALDDLIRRLEPDLVWAQLEGAGDVIERARRRGVPGLLYLHDAEFDRAELRRIGELGCRVICSSAFLAEKARQTLRRAAHLVYPLMHLHFDMPRGASGHGYVTMVNAHPVKGLNTFLEIARRLPHQNFLLVESWKLDEVALQALLGRLATTPNVRFMRRVCDVRAVYAQTRLLLVPSVWEEAFGMVVVEAQSCGIPVIASARGGLRESVGDGGVLVEDYLNVDRWLEAIIELLGDEAAYAAAAERARAHAALAKFAPEHGVRQFLLACAAPVSLPAQGAGVRGALAALNQLERMPMMSKNRDQEDPGTASAG